MAGAATFRSMLSGANARRGLALLAALLVILLPVALPLAHAEPNYPPVFYRISADTFSTRVGGHISFTAQTFKPGSSVSFSVTAGGQTVSGGSASVNAKGIASRTITFDTLGANTVAVSGTSDENAPLQLSTQISVTSANPGGNGGSGANGGNSNGGNGSGDNSQPPVEASSGVPFLGGGLPRTGGDVAVTALIGLALLAGGAVLVFAARRRHES